MYLTAFLDGEIFIIEEYIFDGNKPVAVGHYLDRVYDEAYLEDIEWKVL